jgi:TonB family protein
VPITKPDSPKINLKKNKQDEASALKRLEAMEKLEKMTKAEKQHPSTKSPSASTAPASQPIKGNEIAHGGALSGISKLDNDNYIQTVTDHVKQHWNLPRWLRADNLRAVVKVFVDSSGAVLKKQLIVSSHNETYDELVLTAVDRASPFPAPPPELATRLSVYGFDLDITP